MERKRFVLRSVNSYGLKKKKQACAAPIEDWGKIKINRQITLFST